MFGAVRLSTEHAEVRVPYVCVSKCLCMCVSERERERRRREGQKERESVCV